MTSDSRDNDAVKALDALTPGITPPPALEDRTVAALTARGLLQPSNARAGTVRWLVAAGIAGFAFFGGLTMGGRRTPPLPPSPTFVLMLYGAQSDDSAHAGRAKEYAAWAERPSVNGVVVGGEALAPGGMAFYRPDTNPFSGVMLDVLDDPDPNELVGYFLVNAPTRQHAMRLAAECPHIKYGGRVVVRTIL